MAAASDLGLLTAAFLASVVEFVEAFTIVLAMGMTRSWRSALSGVALAVVALTGVTIVTGYALIRWLPESALQLVIGTLLVIFGLQWLRKAILRASGFKALHDEEQVFLDEQQAARAAGGVTRHGLDWMAFVVSFKGVFLEGLEVVFIVITFGLAADNIAGAAAGAAIAGVLVLVVGAVAHRPLSQVPENSLKFAVGVLLTTFGSYWSIEGLGLFHAGRESLAWPGGDLALPLLLVFWIGFSITAVAWLRRVHQRVRTDRPLEMAE
jgi:Ca2+/H+ antiporter, TMEM165/GDT1 family